VSRLVLVTPNGEIVNTDRTPTTPTPEAEEPTLAEIAMKEAERASTTNKEVKFTSEQ
jgi:hypothetical protein